MAGKDDTPPSGDDSTRLIRAGGGPRPLPRTVGPAIQRGSTVLIARAADLYDHSSAPTYGRAGLEAQAALREALAQMEGGCDALLYPSGLAAISGVLLALLKSGDELLVSDGVYNPTRRFCDVVLRRFGVEPRYFRPDAAAEDVLAMISPATRLILMESPASLTFEMQDVAAIASGARRRGVTTAMDNTWGAGLVFKPLAHGVDISIQALTKYDGGHSDLFMGAAAVADPALAATLSDSAWDIGWSVAPEAAYDMLRGLRTLPVRIARHQESGLAVASWLREQPEVIEVLHPALPGAPGHALWARDYTGCCGLFGVVLRPAPTAAVHAMLDRLRLFGLGFSWGGVESLAIHCDPQFDKRRFRADRGGPVVRLHIGLERPDDLIGDLRAGLDAYAGR